MVQRSVIILLIVMSTLALLARATRTTLQQGTVTVGAGTSDTITISNKLSFLSDSVGLELSVNQDSILGYVRYTYVTSGGYTDTTTIPYMPEAITLQDVEYANFSEAILQRAGAYEVQVYLILTNDNYQSKTIRYTLNQINWR